MLQSSGPVQSTYDRYQKIGQVGTPASETGWDADTRIFEETADPAAGLGFGLVVSQGSNSDRGIRLGVPSGRHVIGITRSSVSTLTTFTDKYADGDNVDVAFRGDWFVIAEAAVQPGDAVLYDPVTGKLGHTGGTTLNGARWMTTAGAGGVAVVRLGDTIS